MINKITEVMEGNKQSLFRYVLYRIGKHEDAEDLLQNVYLQLIDKAETLSKVTNLSNYVFICTVNACNKHIRELQTEREQLADYKQLLENEQSSPISCFEEEFTHHDQLFAALPDEQAEAIRLKIYASRTFEEIATILNIPEATAKSRFYAGLSKLKTILQNSRL